AYMMTAALSFPFDHDWTKIYLYTAGKVCRQHKQAEVPQDILVESLDDDQMRDLNRLKAWLYQKRTLVRGERDRIERRQKREEAAAAREAAQPALFNF
ncbi:unnamed protein product, partial [marine sediment metagenome]